MSGSRDRIRIAGVRATGFHGVFEHEKRDGQPFEVDVTLWVDLGRAGRTDDLSNTVNYGEVAADVVRRIEGEAFDLIERLAFVIAEDALARPLVEAVEVTVHKPEAPVGVTFGDVTVSVERDRGVPVVIALGANLGDAAGALGASVAELAETSGFRVVAVSDLVETEPVGGPEQPAYLNAVLLGTWDGAPADLLRALHTIEARHGRTREVHWGARVLDLDLVQFGTPGTSAEVLLTDPALVLPHPRARERAFVLAPWAAVDPHAQARIGERYSDPIVPVAALLAGLEPAARGGVRPGPLWPWQSGSEDLPW